jgi:hypothetical protein
MKITRFGLCILGMTIGIGLLALLPFYGITYRPV